MYFEWRDTENQQFIRVLTIKILIEQNGQDDFTGMEKLRDKLLMVLKNIQKEKEEEKQAWKIVCIHTSVPACTFNQNYNKILERN